MAVHKKFPALGRGLDALISTQEVHTSGSSTINEIELDKMNANGLEGAQKIIEKKEEELDELEDQAQSLTAQVGQALSEIAQESGEAQTEKTVQTDEKDQSKEQEDPDYLKYSF